MQRSWKDETCQCRECSQGQQINESDQSMSELQATELFGETVYEFLSLFK